MEILKKLNLQLFAGEEINRTTDNVAGNDFSPTMKEYYDTELLVTGTTTGKALSERYEEEKENIKKAPKKKNASY